MGWVTVLKDRRVILSILIAIIVWYADEGGAMHHSRSNNWIEDCRSRPSFEMG